MKAHVARPGLAISHATPEDIPALVALEDASFSTDRLAAANFRQFLRRGNGDLFVARRPGVPGIAGYLLVLYRRGSTAARIYSIAVDVAARGAGVGTALLMRGEDAARGRQCQRMTLEVRPDNAAAISLYEGRGYQVFGRYRGFYEDGTDALRLALDLTQSPA